MLKKLGGAIGALVLALGLVAVGTSSASATQETCPDGTGGWVKTEPVDLPSTVATAPDGFLIAEVCYKAATSVSTYDVDPDAASVTITSTLLNNGGQIANISHYSLRLVTAPPPPPTDVCDNIDGLQETAPTGYETDGVSCWVPPQECSVTTAWGTEADDTPPTLTPDGYLFEGGSGDAVGYGLGISGNLQGLPTITYVATGDLGVFYPRIVINSLADGGYAYDSLTVISEGPVDGSSIAASNKRGFIQHTLDEWAALLPNNQLLAFFFHLDSGATADKAVTLSSVTGGCFSANFAPAVPEPISGEDVDEQVNCETGEVDITTTPWTQDQVWDAESSSYQPGEKVYGEPVVTHRALTEGEYVECYGDQPEPLTGSDKTEECDGSILVITTVDWTQPSVAGPTGWELGEKVYADPKISRVADDLGCIFPPALALTGATSDPTASVVGVMAILAGLALIAAAVRRRVTA